MARVLNKQQEQTIAELGRRFSDATIFLHAAIAQKAGLTVIDHKYLGILLQKGPMTAGELSRLTGLTTGAVTGLIDRLEKKKLVRREFDQKDRRKIIIVPDAENAAKLFSTSRSRVQEQINGMISAFTDSEIRVIEKYLLAAIKVMDEISTDLRSK